MRKIKIGFSKSKKKFAFFSWAIRLFQKTPFSHVYVRRVAGFGEEYVYQASGAMVNFMGIDTFHQLHEVIEEFEFEISAEDTRNLLRKSIRFAGRPYGRKQIFAILLAELFGIKSKSLQDQEYAFICSELVVDLMDAANICKKDSWGKSPDLVTPKDIYKKLKN